MKQVIDVKTSGGVRRVGAGGDTVVHVGGVPVGPDHLTVIAGPSTVESEEQIRAAARVVKRLGGGILRAGVFQPKASPYEFQGLGETALRLLRDAADEAGLPVLTEVADPRDVGLVVEYADALLIAARDMQNLPLLKEVGLARRPVFLERGPAATIEEWMLAAECILDAGNPQVVLCERGIRTFDTAAGATLDLAAVALVKRLSHLPVVTDPHYHGGHPDLICGMARAAVAAGSDGLMIRVHPDPDRALCEGPQSLGPLDFAALMHDVRRLAPLVGKKLP
ncbi:MAG: 3-deoxy-7-phosphoheptulonate synthase [Firmicutes bacterium]|nr:3-deoxy-7-phosphoheptulonate synthase [Bacillota bacterium]